MITDKAKNPEILMQWIDRFYESMETGLNATYGIGPDKDKSWYYAEDNSIIFKSDAELPDEYIRGQQQLPFAPDVYRRQADNWVSNNYPDITFADLGPNPVLPDPIDTVLEVELIR